MILRLSSQAPVSFLVSCYRTRAKGRGRPLVGARSPRYYGPLRPDNGDVHENVAEKYTSHPFTFCLRLSQGAHLLKRRDLGRELKRRDRARVQTGMVEFIALPFPFPSKLKIWSFHVVVVQGRQRNVQKNVVVVVVVLTFPLSWPSWFRKVPISP